MIPQQTGTQWFTKYTAYLVRMWQDNEQKPWRASAQCTRTGETLYFASLESLFGVLLAQTAPRQPNNQQPPEEAATIPIADGSGPARHP